MKRIRTTLGALLILFLTASAVRAQSSAQISGSVRDQTGAVLPGAEIRATQTETGLVRDTLTDETGSYLLPNLATGPYRIEVALPGFRTYVQTGILLQVNSNPVVNAVLEVGQVTDQVEVQANAAMVETRSTSVGQVIENERILELPLNGRNATELIALSGAAIQTGEGKNTRGAIRISIAGSQSFGVTYLLDGAMHNNPFDSLNMPLPFPDALQEFKVETGGLSAQNGVHSGASINSVTRSGTNEFHGNLFEFARNSTFNARNFFATRRDSMKRHQFGGTIGGPIVRNKLFFFGGYQGTTVRQDPSDTLSFVPTAAMLAGDFTTITSPQCRTTGQLNLRDPFVGNRLDSVFFSKAALNVAARLPKTDDPCGSIRWGLRSITDEAQIVGRTDYQLTPDHSLFARYLATINDDPNPYDPNNLLTSMGFGRTQLAQSVTLGSTWVATPNTINSLRIAVNRVAIDRINSKFFSPSDVGINAFTYTPQFTIFTVTGNFNIACGSPCSPVRHRHQSSQLSNDVSLIRGAHQVSLGAAVSRFRVNQRANVRSAPAFTFDGSQTNHALADFLTGKLSLFLQSAPNSMNMDQWYVGLYGQDTFKVTPRLTLNYGMRWEPFFGLQITDSRTEALRPRK